MHRAIRLGVPGMRELWDELCTKAHGESLTKTEEELFRKRGKAMKQLSEDPRYPGLRSHDIEPLTRRYGIKVWESYIENGKSARRMFWVYGPGENEITVIGLEPHPEDAKHGGYAKVDLSDLR